MREEVIIKLVERCLLLAESEDLSTEEVQVFAGQILVRLGASLHWNGLSKEEFPSVLSKEDVSSILEKEETTGGKMMQAGFDLL